MLGLAAVLVLGVVYVAVTFVQVWAAANRDEARPADAIVVLGAAQWGGRPSPVFQARLDHAADLYDEGLADLLVVTGGDQPGDEVTQGYAAYDYLRQRGVPEESLLVEVDGRDTYTELSASANILAARGVGDEVLLVTSPYHALRTAAIASEVGLTPFVSPTAGGASVREAVRETGAVAIGRIVTFRRLSNWRS